MTLLFRDENTSNFNPAEHVNCDGLCIEEVSEVTYSNSSARLKEVFNHFDSKITWCRVPKTGSESLIWSLGLDWKWGHFTTKFMISELGLENYNNAFNFTFVRHPLSRLTSIYEYYRWHNANNLRKGSICIQNFDQWVLMGCPNNIGSNDELQSNGDEIEAGRGVLLQKNQLVDFNGSVNFDFIGKLETIHGDTKKLKKIIRQIDQSFISGDENILHINKGTVGVPTHRAPDGTNRNVVVKVDDWRLYYSIPEVRRKAEEILKEDLDLFNY